MAKFETSIMVDTGQRPSSKYSERTSRTGHLWLSMSRRYTVMSQMSSSVAPAASSSLAMSSKQRRVWSRMSSETTARSGPTPAMPATKIRLWGLVNFTTWL